jgi:hypothetical protein
MIYSIHKNGTPVSTKEFASIQDAIEFAKAPAWAGAKPTKIEMLSDVSYKCNGQVYDIVLGINRKAVASKTATQSSRSPINSKGKFKGSAWLSREMDRADSDY